MAVASKTFSESWHRIAGQRVHLRPGVRVHRQFFRGERWHVLENPFSNQFFRMRPEAWAFVSRLDPRRTVQQVWDECLARFPDAAPGQEAVIRLLAQLYGANLLQYDLASDAGQLFERYRKRRQREVGARLAGIMFLRIPLLDPDRFLVRTLPVVGWLVSWFGALVWLGVTGLAVKALADNWSSLIAESRAVLAPDNLLLLYGGLVVVKVCHEFGHAWFCRKFGGEVHVMGVMFLIFTPLPYVDATSSWGFRSRWQRLLVGAAGMIVEVFVAALAVFVWTRTAPGTLHSLAFNMIFLASVSTVLFNINPLLRFDGYYMLCDLLDIPNLHQRSWRWMSHQVKRHLLGVRHEPAPGLAPGEARWLLAFGILSNIYRVVVFSGILLFIADQFLLLGILMAVVCLVGWVFVPVGRFVHFLATSPALDRVRPRAVGVAAGVAGGLVLLLAGVPFRSHFRAPGMVRAVHRADVASEADGFMARALVTPGGSVAAGTPLVRLENPELALRIAAARARLEEIDLLILQARNDEASSLEPLAQRREAAAATLARQLQEDQDRIVCAPITGIWVAPGLADQTARWVPRGTALGLVVDPADYEFSALVSQQDADRLFSARLANAELRLRGDAGRVLAADRVEVIPAEQTARQAESKKKGKPDAARTPEAGFEVRARLGPGANPSIAQGRTGEIRFRVGSEPLLQQGVRRLWQLLQRRYQL